jgi:hypothetical protein
LPELLIRESGHFLKFIDLGVLGFDGGQYYGRAGFGVFRALFGVVDLLFVDLDALLVLLSLRPFDYPANGQKYEKRGNQD